MCVQMLRVFLKHWHFMRISNRPVNIRGKRYNVLHWCGNDGRRNSVDDRSTKQSRRPFDRHVQFYRNIFQNTLLIATCFD